MKYTTYSPSLNKSIIQDTIDALENQFKAQEIAEMTTETLYDHAHDLSHEIIDSMVIYYSDAFKIVQQVGVCNWYDFSSNHGEITNISQLAYICLYEYISEHDLLYKIVKRLNSKHGKK